jgi:capsular polysaccharide biosynthesis protein/Mrp family chromosome partitioning ATPase
MAQERESATLSDYTAIIARRWRVVVVTALVFMLLGGLYSFKGGSTYTSNASLVIRPILSDPFGDSRIEDVGADTQAKVLDSTVVATTVAKRLKLDRDPKDLVNRLTVENPIGTLILNISFSASTPERAQAGAQAFAQAYLDYRRTGAEQTKKRRLHQLDAQRSTLEASLATASAAVAANPVGSSARADAEARQNVLVTQIGDLETSAASTQSIDTEPGEVIRPADLPGTPTGMPLIVVLLATGVLGALVGVGIALLRDRTDRKVRSHHDLVEVAGQEPLVEIPRPRSGAPYGLPSVVDPAGDEASAYRALRVRLWPRRGTGPRRLLIAGVAGGPAADAVGANLAVTIASSGWSTLLAWPNQSHLADYFAVDAPPNVEVLVGERPIERLLVEPLDVHGLTLLPALARSGPSGVAVETTATAETRLAELGSRFDAEIIVGAPVLVSAESIELCPLVDGVIVVFDPTNTTREQLVRTLELLAAVGTEVLGVVTYRAPSGW